MELPVAHVGHWAVSILYAAPVLLVLGSIVGGARRRRRERRPAPRVGTAGPREPDPAVRRPR